jgi:hypothetical protein
VCGFCNVWVSVCVCVCGFYNVCVGVCGCGYGGVRVCGGGDRRGVVWGGGVV